MNSAPAWSLSLPGLDCEEGLRCHLGVREERFLSAYRMPVTGQLGQKMWMKWEFCLLRKKGLMLDLVPFILEESEIARAESHLLLPPRVTTLRATSILRVQQPRLRARYVAPQPDSLIPPDSLLTWARLLSPLRTGTEAWGGFEMEAQIGGAGIPAQPAAPRAAAEQRTQAPSHRHDAGLRGGAPGGYPRWAGPEGTPARVSALVRQPLVSDLMLTHPGKGLSCIRRKRKGHEPRGRGKRRRRLARLEGVPVKPVGGAVTRESPELLSLILDLGDAFQ